MFFFFFNDTATTEIYTLSLHDALRMCKITLPAQETRVVQFKNPPTCAWKSTGVCRLARIIQAIVPNAIADTDAAKVTVESRPQRHLGPAESGVSKS